MPKYVIKAPRYIDGVVVQASPEHPAIIEVPEGHKIDRELYPLDSREATEKPKPHYVPKDTRHPQSREVHSKPVAEQGKKGRASDSSPI